MSIPSIAPVHKETEKQVKQKSCSSWLGKIVTNALDAGKTLLKVVAVAGFFFTPALAANLNRTYFPNYVGRFIQPGEQRVRMHSAACLDTTLYTSAYCHKITSDILFSGVTQGLIELNKTATEVGTHQLGAVDGQVRSIKFLIDSRFGRNFGKAIAYIEETLLKGHFSLEESPTQTIAYIKKLHAILLDGHPNPKVYLPGQFREGSKYIGSVNRIPYYKAQALHVLDPHEIKRFSTMIKQLEGTGGLLISSEEDKTIWKKVGVHIAPSHRQIEERMQSFAEDLFDLFAQKKDPIEVAAFLHVELAEISPFNTMVGKISRLLVNAVLRRYGEYPALTFFRHEEYLNAICEAVSKKDYSIFAAYLRDELAWTREHMNILLHTPLSQTITYPANSAHYMYVGIKLNQDGTKGLVYADRAYNPKEVFDPQELINFKNAYHAVEERLLQIPHAFTKSVEQIIADIKYIHSKLAHNMNTTPGEYRREINFIYTDYVRNDAKNILSECDYALFYNSEQDIINNKKPRQFTPDEVQAWHRAGALLPSQPGHIAAEMENLADQLILLLTKENDYIYAAAHFHTHFLRIHPFNKYTGKLARLYLSAILTRYMNIPRPILFVEDKMYVKMNTLAVQGNIQAFADWLRDKIIPIQDTLYKRLDAL